MAREELVVPPGQLFLGVAQVLAAEALSKGGLYRRSGRTWLATIPAEARDLASVAERDMWERLASLRRPRRHTGLFASLLPWRTHPPSRCAPPCCERDPADSHFVVSGEDPAADLHRRDGEALAWVQSVGPYPVGDSFW